MSETPAKESNVSIVRIYILLECQLLRKGSLVVLLVVLTLNIFRKQNDPRTLVVGRCGRAGHDDGIDIV